MSDDLTRDLVSADALAAHLREPRLRLVDVRWYLGKPGEGRRAYEAGHLPGAIHLDLDTDFAAPPAADKIGGRHPLPPPERLADRLCHAGIGDGDFVVAYDDVGGWIASRLWWMLDTLGFHDVAVLDGGIRAWTDAGHELATDVPTPAPAEALTLGHEWSNVIDRDDLRARLGTVTLLDARAAPRYRGEIEPIDAYPGHIPSAVNRPTDTNLAADGRFRSPADLRESLEPTFGGGDRQIVTSCGSGVSATHHILAARIAGLREPILYVGSYSDWSRSGYPVAVGPEPGDPPDTK
jgi:thiosulfate/3-mercaptopyruvate sulfurtransferase